MPKIQASLMVKSLMQSNIIFIMALIKYTLEIIPVPTLNEQPHQQHSVTKIGLKQ